MFPFEIAARQLHAASEVSMPFPFPRGVRAIRPKIWTLPEAVLTRSRERRDRANSSEFFAAGLPAEASWVLNACEGGACRAVACSRFSRAKAGGMAEWPMAVVLKACLDNAEGSPGVASRANQCLSTSWISRKRVLPSRSCLSIKTITLAPPVHPSGTHMKRRLHESNCLQSRGFRLLSCDALTS